MSTSDFRDRPTIVGWGAQSKADRTTVVGPDTVPSASVPGFLTRTDRQAPAFYLREGRNVIGRMAQSSTADLQIDTLPSKRMSRAHIRIDVNMVSGRGLVHCLSLCKNDLNATYLNGGELVFGDSIILYDGDVITLPDATLRFSLQEERTLVRNRRPADAIIRKSL